MSKCSLLTLLIRSRGPWCGTRCNVSTPPPHLPTGPLVVLPAHLSTNPDTYTVLLMALLETPGAYLPICWLKCCQSRLWAAAGAAVRPLPRTDHSVGHVRVTLNVHIGCSFSIFIHRGHAEKLPYRTGTLFSSTHVHTVFRLHAAVVCAGPGPQSKSIAGCFYLNCNCYDQVFSCFFCLCL